ncbi:MAG: formyltransferase family protein [Kiritimatiellae bacterium]|nr:formyltransferase family protein [Kiritimatiellia bacterium]MDD5521921.1 formyltransferase family protein [Kiritimatiellia bacterium]
MNGINTWGRSEPFQPGVIASVYYRYLIDARVIQAVSRKIFNLHPSLFPKYQGCSSLTWVMIEGDDFCGYTYHLIDEGCDTGNVLIQKKIAIYDFDTQLSLYYRVMFEAVADFMNAFDMCARGSVSYKRKYPWGNMFYEF